MGETKRQTIIRFNRLWAKAENGCWVWKNPGSKTHRPLFTIGGVRRYAYRAAWELWVGEIPSGLYVCHHCDNGACVNTAHLFLGTAKDNNADMWRKGRGFVPDPPRGDDSWARQHPGLARKLMVCPPERRRRGEAHGNAKLTDDGVREIRRLSKTGMFQREVAKRLGVSQGTVWQILRGNGWVHVK